MIGYLSPMFHLLNTSHEIKKSQSFAQRQEKDANKIPVRDPNG
jgi:hypothetical protein